MSRIRQGFRFKNIRQNHQKFIKGLSAAKNVVDVSLKDETLKAAHNFCVGINKKVQLLQQPIYTLIKDFRFQSNPIF